MTNQRLVLAVSLAAATLALFLAVIAVGGALRAGLAPWPGIAVVVMATAAFVLSREQGSFLVAGLLAASGVVGVVYGLLTTEFLTAATSALTKCAFSWMFAYTAFRGVPTA